MYCFWNGGSIISNLQRFFPQSLSLNSWGGKATSTLCHQRTALQKHQSCFQCSTNKNINYIESPRVNKKSLAIYVWVIRLLFNILGAKATCQLCWFSTGSQSTEVNSNNFPWGYGLRRINTIQHFPETFEDPQIKKYPLSWTCRLISLLWQCPPSPPSWSAFSQSWEGEWLIEVSPHLQTIRTMPLPS